MLELCHRLARRLYPARVVLWILAVSAAVAFLVLLIGDDDGAGERALMPLVLVFAWLAAAISVTHGFRTAPPRADPHASLTARIAIRIQRAYLWCAAALMSVVSIALLLVGVRALVITLGS